jgi:hypothetical protein
MGYEAEARTIQDFYLAGDSKGAIAAVPAKLVEDVALIGPWAKIADEIQRWKQTVLTTFSVHCDARDLPRIADQVRWRRPLPCRRSRYIFAKWTSGHTRTSPQLRPCIPNSARGTTLPWPRGWSRGSARRSTSR